VQNTNGMLGRKGKKHGKERERERSTTGMVKKWKD
jgi:hypothetical protein